MQSTHDENAHGLIQAISMLVSQQTIDTAILEAKQYNQSLLHHLIQEKILSSSEIANACATYFNVDYVDLSTYHYNQLPIEHVSKKWLEKYILLPLTLKEQSLLIAISDPNHFHLIEEIKFQTKLTVKFVIASYEQLTFLINKILSQQFYASNHQPIVKLIDRILTDAIYQQASDVHFESTDKGYRIRARIDGILTHLHQLSAELSMAIASRLKVMANLDIAEKRLPQDGRFSFRTKTNLIRDCRLSTCPTIYGEKLVIRILNPQKKLLSLNQLGLTKKQKQHFLHSLKKPQGLILVTGPTGSGKTISLYAALNSLDATQKNILTIEDPVEIQLNHINQVNTNYKAGLDFLHALRAFLRQDPDIIMVGEIRDHETATMAIRAALTGHLVLSTLHTNSAAEALTRLIDMGIPHYHIASAVNLIIAQRLLRKLCVHCKTPSQQTHDMQTQYHDPQPCQFCTNGYLGRMGVFEVLPISPAIRELILSHQPAHKLSTQAEEEGMETLWQAALNKVYAGITSLEEIHRVIEKR